MRNIDYTTAHSKAIIRLLSYGLAIACIAVIAIILVYVARGYDIDRDTGEVIQNGLVLVETDPVSADVFVDNEFQNDATPSRLALPQGSYSVRLDREGYRSWEKKVSLGGSAVRWLNYPLMIPNEFAMAPLSVPGIADYSKSYLSTDRKKLYLQIGATDFLIYEPTDMSREPLELTINRELLDIEDEEEKPGKITVHDTSANGKWAIISHVHPERKTKEYIVFVVRDTEEFTNLSQALNVDISSIAHIDADYKEFLITDDTGVTWLFNRESAEITQLSTLDNVIDFVNFERRIAYVREGSRTSQLVTLNNLEDEPVVAFNFPKSADVQNVEILEYERSVYVIVLYSDKALVFKDPFSADEAPYAPFRTILLPADASEVEYQKSTRSRFFSFFTDTEATTYDLDEDEIHTFSLDASDGKYEWIDNFRFAATDNKGNFRIMEFDGTNKHLLFEPGVDSENYVSFDLKSVVNIRQPQDDDEAPQIYTGSLLP